MLPSAALESAKSNAELCERLVADGPDDDLLQRDAYVDFREQAERLAATDPKNVNFRRDLAVSRERLADAAVYLRR